MLQGRWAFIIMIVHSFSSHQCKLAKQKHKSITKMLPVPLTDDEKLHCHDECKYHYAAIDWKKSTGCLSSTVMRAFLLKSPCHGGGVADPELR
jgi:hypothetical protein